jgi:hypothetical protein
MRWSLATARLETCVLKRVTGRASAAVAWSPIVLSLPPSAGAASRLMGRRALMLSLIAVTAADVTF